MAANKARLTTILHRLESELPKATTFQNTTAQHGTRECLNQSGTRGEHASPWYKEMFAWASEVVPNLDVILCYDGFAS